jgi:ABC-type polysaccharide/polyol phosphate transport system ATPase subunit
MRTYSAGMNGRLAFAVATHLDPEILLIDEALSAGDARFRGRCSERIRELCQGDRTVMLVSHGLGYISELCDLAVWIEKGAVYDEGPAEEVVDAYIEHEERADPRVTSQAALEDI